MISIAGLDRVSALELKELFEEGAGPDTVRIEADRAPAGQAGSLGGVTALLLAHGPEIAALLLTAWIVSKKHVVVDIARRNRDGETKKLRIEYHQDGVASVLKTLKSFFSEDI